MRSYADDDLYLNEIECPNCGTRVNDEVLVCPKCGLHFYADEITEATEDEDLSQERVLSISAILAGWLASAAVAFLVNFFASRIWSQQTLNFVGQAIIFFAGPLGALSGGYLSARLAGKRIILHGVLVAILSLVTAVLLETYWYDLFSAPLRPATIASWLVLLLAGPAGAWIWMLFAAAAQSPSKPRAGEKQLYLDLLARVRHDINTAERLIDYERRRNPSAGRAVLIQYAMDRIDHDRR